MLDLSCQATIDLDNLWMTNKPFQNFMAKFNRLAAKSGKMAAQKLELLKTKVLQELAAIVKGRSDKPTNDDCKGQSKLYQKIYLDLLVIA